MGGGRSFGRMLREAIVYQIGCFFTHCVKRGGGGPDLNEASINLDPDDEKEEPSCHWNTAQTSPQVL